MKHLFALIFCLFSVNFVYAAEKIDVNTAPLEDLVKIIHIGEARALELISLRPFSSLDGLVRIKGIGEKRVEDIKNQGLAWVEPRLRSEPPKPEDGTQKQTEVEFPPTLGTPGVNEKMPNEPSVKPGLTDNLPLGAAEKSNNTVLISAAVFTSLFGSGIILILKKNLKLG